MEALRFEQREDVDFTRLTPDVTEADQRVWERITAVDLTAQQVERLRTPPFVDTRQREVIAVHWHPEFVPMDLVMDRVRAMFPNAESELIIPTQHNVLMSLNGYAGVEIDCYSPEFNTKVQLLAHFAEDKVRDADVLRKMLAHTFRYRNSQLTEFIDTVLEPAYQERVDDAAEVTGASDDLVRFVQIHVEKVRRLIEANEDTTPPDALKNKLLRNFLNEQRTRFDDELISHAQIFLTAIKRIVKANFSMKHFYLTNEIIEEVRGLGGRLVIPHPEQFWPILLADYDVDGIEVWNPQSQQYTEFLIQWVNRHNKSARQGEPLLIFMGDDTHFGEKTIDPALQAAEKAGRELGVQPAWDNLLIRKSLIVGGADRARLIEDYKSRLG
ncbi:MAG: hypothetical protein KDA32_07315 [Phycisphaerales bacterium]|nr:hypothetical protein [Phycisphaerales bacterium]